MFKLDNFGVILFVLFSYKKLLQCSFYENLQKSIKNSKKFVYYNENMYTNSKFQKQFSRKLQRLRTCRKNKNCSIFHDLSEYVQTMATFFRPNWFSYLDLFDILKIFYLFSLLFPILAKSTDYLKSQPYKPPFRLINTKLRL
jgi:hypothetical protein